MPADRTTEQRNHGAMASKYAFSTALRELRIQFCQTSEPSNGIRTFLKTAYPVMKKHNPHIPILIREAAGVQPRVFARYEHGREESRMLDGLNEKQVEGEIEALARR